MKQHLHGEGGIRLHSGLFGLGNHKFLKDLSGMSVGWWFGCLWQTAGLCVLWCGSCGLGGTTAGRFRLQSQHAPLLTDRLKCWEKSLTIVTTLISHRASQRGAGFGWGWKWTFYVGSPGFRHATDVTWLQNLHVTVKVITTKHTKQMFADDLWPMN